MAARRLLKGTGWPMTFLFSSRRWRSDDLQMMKNCVTTAAETALLGARSEEFRAQGIFEIIRAVQKVTGNCL
jgi:hypothetical protein